MTNHTIGLHGSSGKIGAVRFWRETRHDVLYQPPGKPGWKVVGMAAISLGDAEYDRRHVVPPSSAPNIALERQIVVIATRTGKRASHWNPTHRIGGTGVTQPSG